MRQSMLAACAALSISTLAQASMVTVEMTGTITSKQTFFDGFDAAQLAAVGDGNRAAVNGAMANLNVGQTFTTSVSWDPGTVTREAFQINSFYEVVNRELLKDSDTIVALSDLPAGTGLLRSLGPIGENDVIVKVNLPAPQTLSTTFSTTGQALSLNIPEAGLDYSKTALANNPGNLYIYNTGVGPVIDPLTSRKFVGDKGGSALSLGFAAYIPKAAWDAPMPELDHTAYGLDASFSMNTGALYAESDLNTILQGFDDSSPDGSARINVMAPQCQGNPFGYALKCGYVEFEVSSMSVLVSSVPEPRTWLLMGLGLVGLFFARRHTEQPRPILVL